MQLSTATPASAPRARRDLDQELACATAARALFDACPSAIRLGRFELTRSLGRGAMGAVYAAHDPQLGHDVALKVLHRRDAHDASLLEREFRALADVTHPNLAVLYELFVEPAPMFFTMELVDGVSLDQWLRGPHLDALDIARLRAALPQLACAVAAIHSAGKLHCDIKPSNVRVTPLGRVVLLDYGLVREIHEQGELHPRKRGGTPAYLAPEQLASAAANRARDWYAFGVVLFEALTGRLPFSGPSASRDKLTREAPDPRSLDASLPPDLCELCAALLRRHVEERAWALDVLRQKSRSLLPGHGAGLG